MTTAPKEKLTGLSKSTLEIFMDCPRCFWLAKVGKLERPRSPMPSVLNAIDASMKAWVELNLLKPETIVWLGGSTAVPFPDRDVVENYRSWRSFQAVIQTHNVKVKAWGELDELLLHPDKTVSPWDFKSKGSAGDEEYSKKYYQLQADMYHLLLDANGHTCSGFCYFTYIWPMEFTDKGMQWNHSTHRIASDPHRATAVLEAATLCLEGACPPSRDGCTYCAYVSARKGD
jgi:hypothetical protein